MKRPNAQIVSEKGKLRNVKKKKRPAAKKNLAWKSIPYVREAPSQDRKDRTPWKRTLPQLLRADNQKIIRILVQDKILPDWKGKTCPRCSKGTLSKLYLDSDSRNDNSTYKHRCRGRSCRARMNSHHLHPLFTEGSGPQMQSLQTQADALFLKLHRVPQSTIHQLMNINHKALEDLENKHCRLRQEHVEEKEKHITFGGEKTWVDIKADEATFDKKDVSNSSTHQHLVRKPNKTMLWEQWAGVVQRGRPETLVLRKLTPKLTVKRAPGPGANRKTEWDTMAHELLAGRSVILHTDSAKSYEAKVDGVLHDPVVHCKKRTKVKGKWVWQNPKYVSTVKHHIPGTNKQLKVKSGTQIIDRAWRLLNDRTSINQNVKAGSISLRAKLRSAQYEYWYRNHDLGLSCGKLCSEAMKKVHAALSVFQF